MVCTQLNAPVNGHLIGTDVFYGSVVTAACDPGFMFADSSLAEDLQCVSDGSVRPVALWSANVRDCQRSYYAL